jgi:hypothetical protein
VTFSENDKTSHVVDLLESLGRFPMWRLPEGENSAPFQDLVKEIMKVDLIVL